MAGKRVRRKTPEHLVYQVEIDVQIKNFHKDVLEHFEHPSVSKIGENYLTFTYNNMEEAGEYYEQDLDDVMNSLKEMHKVMHVRDRMLIAVQPKNGV